MIWYLLIFGTVISIVFTCFYVLNNVVDLRIKFTRNYRVLNDIIIYKAKQSYEIFRIRDLAVYINNDTRLSQEDFILYATSFRDFFKTMCGDTIYSLACKVYGGEPQFKKYLTLVFHNYIIDDKLVKASEALFANFDKQGANK